MSYATHLITAHIKRCSHRQNCFKMFQDTLLRNFEAYHLLHPGPRKSALTLKVLTGRMMV